MKPSEDLFELIRSMSASEKRYFRIYAQRHVIGEENSYLKVFNAVEKMGAYDEKALLKKFQGESFAKNISFTKNYLYRLILGSLRSFHAGKTVDAQLRDMLADIAQLHSRRLYEQCGKILEKALKLAAGHEKFHEYIRLLEWKIALLRDNCEIARLERELMDVFVEMEQTLEHLHNGYDYLALGEFSNVAIRRNSFTKNLDLWETILERFGSLIKNPELARSWAAKMNFYKAKINFHSQRGESDEVYRYGVELVEHYHANPHMIAQYLSNYVSAMRSVMNSFRLKGRFDDIRVLMERLQRLPSEFPEYMTEIIAMSIFSNTCQYELYFAYDSGDEKHILEIVAGIRRSLKHFEHNLPPLEQYLIRINSALSLYDVGFLCEALELVNEIINNPNPNLSPFTQTSARLLSLIIHYDLGNFELIESLARSTERFNIANKCSAEITDCTIRLLRQLSMTDDESRKQKYLEKARAQIMDIPQNILYEYPLSSVILDWINRKLNYVTD